MPVVHPRALDDAVIFFLANFPPGSSASSTTNSLDVFLASQPLEKIIHPSVRNRTPSACEKRATRATAVEGREAGKAEQPRSVSGKCYKHTRDLPRINRLAIVG